MSKAKDELGEDYKDNPYIESLNALYNTIPEYKQFDYHKHYLFLLETFMKIHDGRLRLTGQSPEPGVDEGKFKWGWRKASDISRVEKYCIVCGHEMMLIMGLENKIHWECPCGNTKQLLTRQPAQSGGRRGMITYKAKVRGSNLSATYYTDVIVSFFNEPDEFELRGKILRMAKRQMGEGLSFDIKNIQMGVNP